MRRLGLRTHRYLCIPGPWFDAYFLVSPKKRRRDQKHNTGQDSTKNITPKDQKHNTKAPKYNTKAQKYDTKVVSCPFFRFRPKIQRHQKKTSFRWSRYIYIYIENPKRILTIQFYSSYKTLHKANPWGKNILALSPLANRSKSTQP